MPNGRFRLTVGVGVGVGPKVVPSRELGEQRVALSRDLVVAPS